MESKLKLSPLTVIVIGIALSLIAVGFGLRNFLPNTTEAQYQNDLADKLRDEANKQAAANKRVEMAVKKVQEMAAEWQRVVAVKTPGRDLYRGGINLAVNRWQLTHDALIYRDSVQRAVNAQVRRGGVRVVQGPNVPSPSPNAADVLETYFNYPAIKFPVVIFDLGQVTVTGTLDQILANVESWRSMPNYLAVADGLRLNGTSPNLTGTYSVTVVGYIRGDSVAPIVPQGSASNQAGGGGGGATGGGGGGRGASAPGVASSQG